VEIYATAKQFLVIISVEGECARMGEFWVVSSELWMAVCSQDVCSQDMGYKLGSGHRWRAGRLGWRGCACHNSFEDSISPCGWAKKILETMASWVGKERRKPRKMDERTRRGRNGIKSYLDTSIRVRVGEQVEFGLDKMFFRIATKNMGNWSVVSGQWSVAGGRGDSGAVKE
jgi:hypothetical protein